MATGERSPLTSISVYGSDKSKKISLPPSFKEFYNEIQKLDLPEGKTLEFEVDGEIIDLREHYSIVTGYPNSIKIKTEIKPFSPWDTILPTILLMLFLAWVYDWVMEWLMPEFETI